MQSSRTQRKNLGQNHFSLQRFNKMSLHPLYTEETKGTKQNQSQLRTTVTITIKTLAVT